MLCTGVIIAFWLFVAFLFIIDRDHSPGDHGSLVGFPMLFVAFWDVVWVPGCLVSRLFHPRPHPDFNISWDWFFWHVELPWFVPQILIAIAVYIHHRMNHEA